VLKKKFEPKRDELTAVWNNLHNELTPWSRVLLDNPAVSAPKELLTLYGSQRFISVFTRAHHWSFS
jgi:hypothetical protein